MGVKSVCGGNRMGAMLVWGGGGVGEESAQSGTLGSVVIFECR